MEVSVKSLKRVDVVKVAGRVDSNSAPEFEKALKDLWEADRNQIVLDLEDVDYLSSAGLRVMVTALKQVKKSSGDLRVAAPSTRVSEVLHLAGLNSIFQIYPTQLDAVGSF
jgi:anti-sigma B factor antagonist